MFEKGMAKGLAKISLLVLAVSLVGFFAVNFVQPTFAIDTPYCTTTGGYQVCTDQEDYSPTFIVHVAGSGFASDYSYLIKVTRPDGSVVTGDGSFGEWPSYYDIAVTDAGGNFQFDYILDGIFGEYKIEVLDLENNVLANHSFTDDVVYGKIIVTKSVVGGTKTAGDFTITATGTCAPSPSSFSGSSTGTTVTCTTSGSRTLIISESPVTGYTTTFSSGCSGTIGNGDTKTCTVTNTYVAPSCDATACNANDGWYDTGTTQWISTGQCTEKEQKEQEYRDYSCVSDICTPSSTGTQWIDTNNNKNKPDGTACNDGLYCTVSDVCSAGVCGGSAKDCSGNNLPEIATCDNNPDNIHYTWDSRNPFTSTCDETIDSCTNGNAITITHQSPTIGVCNVECLTDNDCTSLNDACAVGVCNLGTYTCEQHFKSSSTVCRASGGACDPEEICTGTTATCPADAKSTSECRASAGVCDVAEVCDGVNNDCPTDSFKASTFECRASGGACDIAEFCTGASATCPSDLKSTAVCRAADGVCDVAESCDGTNNDCPTDAVKPGTFVCKDSAGICDVAENCDGTTKVCPTDVFKPSTEVCRASAGACDVADYCSGSSADCTADIKSTTECRASAGQCDVAESCDGVNNDCPADAFKAVGTSCDDGLFCNVDETCDGTGACTGGSALSCSGNDIGGIAACDNDAILSTFDWRNPFESICDETNDECPTGDNTVNHVCADADNTDGVFNYGGIQTCSAQCDGAGTECEPYIDSNDYCQYDATCNTAPASCSCDYDDSSYCPTSGTIGSGTCYYGTQSCTGSGCGLSHTAMGTYDTCDPVLGPIDTIPPTVGISGAPADWINTDQTATVTCSDSGSGCDATSYKIKIYSSNPVTCPTGYSQYTLTSPQTISSHSWVCGAAKDNTGNTGYSSPVEFKVDEVPPTITDDYANDNVWINTATGTITLTPLDTGDSGLKADPNAVKYCTGSGCDPSTGTTLSSPYQLSFSAEQNTIVRYQSYDNAGSSSTVGEFIVKIDLTAPTTSDDYTDTNWYSTDRSITLTPADTGGSGIQWTKYCESTGCNPATGTSYSGTVTYTTTGDHVFRYASKDNAGNVQTTVEKHIKIDKTAPSGGSITYTDGYYTTASVPITYTLGTDTDSGLDTASGKIQRASATLSSGVCGSFSSFSDLVSESDGSYADTSVLSDNCYKYQYVISDNVGNTATYTSTSVAKVDTTPPELGITGATADGNDMSGTLEAGYNLLTHNFPAVHHAIQFKAGTAASEALQNDKFGLFLTGADAAKKAELKAYYDSRAEIAGTPFLDYLKDAVDGDNPFVYILGDGATTAVQLADAAKLDILTSTADMDVPDDYPLGTYTVTGKIKDIAGNEKTVTLILIVSGDRVPPVITITQPNTLPAQSKTITASADKGTLYQSVTTGSVCDGTLTFVAYADITFTSESDNGKRVCYKASLLPTDNLVTYELSATIAGIDTTAPTVILTDDHADSIVRDADNVLITATFTENDQIDETSPPTISINSVGLVNNEPMTKVSNLVWTYSWDVPAGYDGAHTVTILAYDRAGNENTAATGKTSYTIDNTAPTISGAATTLPNANGWYKTSVTVHFDCTDIGGSGVASVTDDQTLTGEGAGQSVLGTCTDTAGNSASTTVSGINIDKTAPSLNSVGFDADGVAMTGNLADGYTLLTHNFPAIHHKIQYSGTASETLNNEKFGLYLTGASAEVKDALKAYYDTRTELDSLPAFRAYLKEAVDGTKPFAYFDGSTVKLVDAAKWYLLGVTDDMDVPDDYPLGTYTVTGGIKDLADNTQTVTFKLIVTGDRVLPVITIVNPDTTPAQSKTITATKDRGTLYMNINSGGKCDDTLAFVAYADTTFTSQLDNGKTVCYKADLLPTDNVVSYKLSATIAGIDTTPPTLTATFAADGDSMPESPAGTFTLLTHNVAATHRMVQFDTGTSASETLKDELFGLYLKSSSVSTANLTAYYNGRAELPTAFRNYLIAALDGTTHPFAYIDGSPLKLLDAAKTDLLGTPTENMDIPDDYPIGNYTVSGTIYDLAGNPTVVSYTLIVAGYAAIEYTGDTSILTAGPLVNTAPVQLSAQLTQENNDHPRDITLAKVTFVLTPTGGGSTITVPNIPVNALGEAFATWNVPTGVYNVKVSISAGNLYWIEHPYSGEGALTIALGSNDQRVTGGGWIPDTKSTNGKDNFGFTVNYNKNGAPKGNLLFMFRGTDGYNYQVKSTAWSKGGLSFTSTNKAYFTSQCNVKRIDRDTGLVDDSFGGGNWICTVNIQDLDLNVKPVKTPDTFAITIFKADGTIWKQVGTPISQISLGGGNVVVHSK